MGIIVRDDETKEVSFLMKGADTVMSQMVQYNDWLEEECSNMAREGLRTLVVARKILSPEQLADFETQFHTAKMSLTDRNQHIAAVLRRLETDLQLLCLTGVEDSLQDQVTTSLELLRNAGIKVWMLTGDKLETAICIAKSSGLFSKTDNIHVFGNVQNRRQARTELDKFKKMKNIALVMQGSSLDTCLRYFEAEVAGLVCECSAVVCCRCSPEQKAQIVNLLKRYKKPARVAAIGDGGNDVSMIQAAHAGIGIDAKEGKQASLAADFSVTQFHHICRLFLVHGRFCYKRSCSLSQFVIHRGLILSVIQAIFSWMFFFVSFSFYPGVLLVGYATAYTMFPVFSLVLDRDITSAEALLFPQMYGVLRKGRSLSIKTFCIWLMISLYQGTVVMCGSYVGVYDNNFVELMATSFTALVFTELIMVALTIHKWHWAMYLSLAISIICFMGSMLYFNEYFDIKFITSSNFMLRTSLIILLACLPLYIIKVTRRALSASTTYNQIY
uniref:Phospholipid-transporting ATPase n=1 Tax=Panagrolaimus davidi TaxID=227884 RepID=A0A914Q8F5_9BILA